MEGEETGRQLSCIGPRGPGGRVWLCGVGCMLRGEVICPLSLSSLIHSLIQQIFIALMVYAKCWEHSREQNRVPCPCGADILTGKTRSKQ